MTHRLSSSLALIILASIFVFAPMIASAALVPCGGPNQDPCTVCHLSVLAQNFINFVIRISFVIAALAFASAGVIFFTAGADSGKISRAKQIFGSTFIGLVIVLSAWLLVSVIVHTLTGQGLNIFTAPLCGQTQQKTQPAASLDGGGVPSGKPLTGITVEGGEATKVSDSFPVGYVKDLRKAEEKEAEEMAVREELTELCRGIDSCTISVNKSSCPPNTPYTEYSGGCTDLSRIVQETKDIIAVTAFECGTFAENRNLGKCLVQVTGGSELGHTSDTNGCGPDAFSHCSGNKVDISKVSARVVEYVNSNEYFTDGTCPGNRKGRVHKVSGSCWVDEDAFHYDVYRKL